jgi:DNA-binding MarR family transcriptional regulator/N-acetylglutamate synthase-like GNAT family acetyltransferase
VANREGQIAQIRSFNRFYTKQLGLLREQFLETRFTLTQARVLYELGRNSPLSSTALIEALGLDKGYLSRLLKVFEKQELVKRAGSSEDRRVSRVSLTAKGRRVFEQLDRRSRDEIDRMLAAMRPTQRKGLSAGMKAIRESMGYPDEAPQEVILRLQLPGDIGWVVERHGELYAKEFAWDSAFEGLVAEIAGTFLKNFDAQRERCWIAERGGERLGCVFLVRKSARIAKLRLLLVEPAARGLGIGARLVNECVDFARQCGYRKLTLWTNDILVSARRIYESAGFCLTKEEKHHTFGHDLVGQFWELKL